MHRSFVGSRSRSERFRSLQDDNSGKDCSCWVNTYARPLLTFVILTIERSEAEGSMHFRGVVRTEPSFRAQPFFRRREGSHFECIGGEISRPAGESAGASR